MPRGVYPRTPEHTAKNREGHLGIKYPDRRRIHLRSPEDGSGRIPLTEGEYALCDEEDFDVLTEFQWEAYFPGREEGSIPYATTGMNGRRVSMARFLLELAPDDPRVVDHVNRNRLDNHRSNLRIATHQQNTWNRPSDRRSSSRFKGVYKSSKYRWYSCITCNGVYYYLGTFQTEEEAARTYDEKARELFREFAYLNFPDE